MPKAKTTKKSAPKKTKAPSPKKLKAVVSDKIEHIISKSAIKRLVYIGGSGMGTRASLFQQEAGSVTAYKVMEDILSDVLNRSVELANLARRKTIGTSDIVYAASTMGDKFYPSNEVVGVDKFKVRIRRKGNVKKGIEAELKRHGISKADKTLFIARAQFNRAIQSVLTPSPDQNNVPRIKKLAKINLQLYVESKMIKMFAKAAELAGAAGRKKIGGGELKLLGKIGCN